MKNYSSGDVFISFCIGVLISTIVSLCVVKEQTTDDKPIKEVDLIAKQIKDLSTRDGDSGISNWEEPLKLLIERQTKLFDQESAKPAKYVTDDSSGRMVIIQNGKATVELSKFEKGWIKGYLNQSEILPVKDCHCLTCENIAKYVLTSP